MRDDEQLEDTENYNKAKCFPKYVGVHYYQNKIMWKSCLCYKQNLPNHSAAFEVNLKKNTVSGCKVILIQFFALISNLKSEFENLRRVFFYCLLYFLMPYCRFIWKYMNDVFCI